CGEVTENAVSLLVKNYAIAHGRVIESAERTEEADFAKSMGMRVHSVAWQVWHIARWDDRFAELMVEKTTDLARRFGPPSQIWASESLAKQWSLPIGHMGRRDTGTEMDDESADALRLPEKALVLDYARRVFARLQTVLEAMPEASLFVVMPDDPDGDSYAHNVMLYLDHVQRHLGMIEALRGQQGTPGTATN
ncbi:MAG: DinB family protein, partial [Chloroflexi bacterium]